MYVAGEDILGGLDYIPSFYHVLLQDPRARPVVAELNGDIVCFFVTISLCVSLCLFLSVSLCLSISFAPSPSLSPCLALYVSIPLSICIHVSLNVSISLSMFPSLSLCFHLSLFLTASLPSIISCWYGSTLLASVFVTLPFWIYIPHIPLHY